MPQTQSQYITTVVANPPGGTVRTIGTFTTFSGGGVTAEVVPDRGPLDDYPTQAGAERAIAEITVGRRVDTARDTAELEDYLASLVGTTNAFTIQRKPVVKKNPFGKGTTWVATLTAMNPTDSDNNSTGDATSLELVFAPSRRS